MFGQDTEISASRGGSCAGNRFRGAYSSGIPQIPIPSPRPAMTRTESYKHFQRPPTFFLVAMLIYPGGIDIPELIYFRRSLP